jgi:hypothetical protein
MNSIPLSRVGHWLLRSWLGRSLTVLSLVVLTFSASLARVPSANAVPSLTGNYAGDYLYQDSTGMHSFGIDINIIQNGSSLGVAAIDGSTGAGMQGSGTVDTGGNFTIILLQQGVFGWKILRGTVITLSSGLDISGSATLSSPVSTTGSWFAFSLPTISGNYTGTWDTWGSSGTHTMQIQVTQIGGSLGGSTTESGQVSTNSGRLGLDGGVVINESPWGATLYSAANNPGHLGGTWNGTGGSMGDWNVTAS